MAFIFGLFYNKPDYIDRSYLLKYTTKKDFPDSYKMTESSPPRQENKIVGYPT